MTRIILLALLLAVTAPPASAFKFFGPNGHMEDSPEDIARRKSDAENKAKMDQHNAEVERAWKEEQARIHEHNAQMNDLYRSAEPQVCPTCPEPRTKYNDGPRPGGHRRHLWRENTGFNTPAERTRYIRENNRLKRELAKEQAKPNPNGSTVQEMRAKRKKPY